MQIKSGWLPPTSWSSVREVNSRKPVIRNLWISHNEDRLLQKLTAALSGDSALLALPQSAWSFESLESDFHKKVFQNQSLQRIVLVGHSRYFSGSNTGKSSSTDKNRERTLNGPDYYRETFNRQAEEGKREFAGHFFQLAKFMRSQNDGNGQALASSISLTGLLYLAQFGSFAQFQPEQNEFQWL